MRTSKYKKKSNLTKKQKQYIMGGIGACLLAGVIFFFTYFQVTDVEVMGSNRYTEKEIRSMILRGPMARQFHTCASSLFQQSDRGDSFC